MTKDLECYSREPTNADELTEVCPYCNGARQNDEQLQTSRAAQFNNRVPGVTVFIIFLSKGTTLHSIYKVDIKCIHIWILPFAYENAHVIFQRKTNKTCTVHTQETVGPSTE